MIWRNIHARAAICPARSKSPPIISAPTSQPCKYRRGSCSPGVGNDRDWQLNMAEANAPVPRSLTENPGAEQPAGLPSLGVGVDRD